MNRNHDTTTLNWDTVFAVPITVVNKAIKDTGSSPRNFQLQTSSGSSCKGSFKDWQINSGGDGSNIRMKIPIYDFKGVIIDEDAGMNTRGSFTYADMIVQVKLNYLPHDEPSKDSNIKLLDLKVRSKSDDPIDPAIVGISLNNVENLHYEANTKWDINPFIDIEDIIKNAFMELTVKWLTENLSLFNHIFNVVNLNLYIDDDEQWSWCKPSYVDYAYTDVAGDLDKSLLGVLCMTGGREGTINQQRALDPYAIPKNSQSAFLIAEERLLREVILPTLPMKFKDSKIEDYEVINATGESGQYQYILRLKRDKRIKLDRIKANGAMYDPYMTEMSISLFNNTLKMEATTETSIGMGGSVGCSTTNWYNLALGKNNKGEQIIVYEETQTPVETHYVIKEGDDWIWDVIAIIIGLIAEAVLAVFTSGASLLIGSVVIVILTGTLAKTSDFIEHWNFDTSPSIDMMLENSTSQIVWNSSDIFNLDHVALAGPLQLGGTLDVTNA